MLMLVVALPRLERIYRNIIDEKLDVDVDIIRVSDVDRSYPILRQIDWDSDTSDKHIVIDFSTNRDVQKVLRQVSAFVMCLLVVTVVDRPSSAHLSTRNCSPCE